jgi:hypothetical protein
MFFRLPGAAEGGVQFGRVGTPLADRFLFRKLGKARFGLLATCFRCCGPLFGFCHLPGRLHHVALDGL